MPIYLTELEGQTYVQLSLSFIGLSNFFIWCLKITNTKSLSHVYWNFVNKVQINKVWKITQENIQTIQNFTFEKALTLQPKIIVNLIYFCLISRNF